MLFNRKINIGREKLGNAAGYIVYKNYFWGKKIELQET